MDRSKQREIASKGGKAAHQKGTAHEWTSEEAREAGRKGGMASHRRKQEQQPQSSGSEMVNQSQDDMRRDDMGRDDLGRDEMRGRGDEGGRGPGDLPGSDEMP